jgi:SAM-dependent methyltransferase
MKMDQRRWDRRYRRQGFALGEEPNPFLRKHIHLFPKGRALDLAAGEGRNAVFLARHGFDVDAVDISEVGLKKAKRFARDLGAQIHTIRADLDDYLIEKKEYDLICDFYFLDRRLIPRIKRGLKKGGRIISETYLIDHRDLAVQGPKHARYYLKHNELLRQFNDFRILFYREGIFREGGRKKAIASLIAEKT